MTPEKETTEDWSHKPRFQRIWAMPDANTFEVMPIGQLVKWYIHHSKVSIDPFARNNRWCTYTNDLNPDTSAGSHMDANAFLQKLIDAHVLADVVILDPPYSPRQVQECYSSIGRTVTQEDTQLSGYLSETKKLVNNLVKGGGTVITCGWSSTGMGLELGYVLEEVMLVCHGGGHNDTIVTVETKRIPRQYTFRLEDVHSEDGTPDVA